MPTPSIPWPPWSSAARSPVIASACAASSPPPAASHIPSSSWPFAPPPSQPSSAVAAVALAQPVLAAMPHLSGCSRAAGAAGGPTEGEVAEGKTVAAGA